MFRKNKKVIVGVVKYFNIKQTSTDESWLFYLLTNSWYSNWEEVIVINPIKIIVKR